MDVWANPVVFVSLRNRSLMRHRVCMCCLLLSAVLIQEEMTTEARPWPDSKSTDICYQPCIHSHLCRIFAHLTSGLPDISNLSSSPSHSISSKLHSLAYSDHVLNSQATDTLPTLATDGAICFKGSGRSHLLKHMTGNTVRVRGSGAKGSLELSRMWKELSKKLWNSTLVNCLGMVLGTRDPDEVNLIF